MVAPNAETATVLKTLLTNSLLRRVSADKWEQFTKELLSKAASRISLSDIILEESLLRSSLNDPLYPQYIDHALKVHLLPPIDVLSSLAAVIPDLQNYSESVRYPIVRLLSQALELWRPFPQSNKRELDVFWTVVSAVHQLVIRENLRRDNLIPIESLDTLNKLLTLPSLRPIFKAQRDKENNERWNHFFNIELPGIRQVFKSNLLLDESGEFDTLLTNFTNDLSPPTLLPDPEGPEPIQLPILESRGAMVAWFMLMRESMTLGDTEHIWNMIRRMSLPHATAQDVCKSLILAGFDALAIVLKRSDITLSAYPEPMTEVALYQSIIVNRIPPILAQHFSVTTDEVKYGVLEAFSRLDAVLANLNLAQIAEMEAAQESGELTVFTPKDFRQDFLYAMVKWGLVTPELPAEILGVEMEEIVPVIDVRDILEEAGDIMDEDAGIERVIQRFATLDGNQSIITNGILELVQGWCTGHNIHALSVLCSGLMRDPLLIEQLFVHISIPKLLEPLCQFLDTWKIDEEDDNGDYPVVFAQYNSILFLVCYCVHHFGRESSLNNPNGPGFVRTWLREYSKAKWLDMLSDEDSSAIGTWITALFDGEGISDDLIRMSPPYRWLQISTTLIQQSVSAYRQGVLQLKTLRDGFEYFMQPFLEPCLLGAISYLTGQLKVGTPDSVGPYLDILSSLLSFLSSVKQEDDIFSGMPLEPAQSRVLQILAPSILSTISQLSLQQASSVKNLQNQLDPIIETLRPYSTQLRPAIPANRKDVINTLRENFSNILAWSAGWMTGLAVPQGVDLRYLAAAVRTCGTSVTIRNVVDEMRSLEETSSYHAVTLAGALFQAQFDIGFGKEGLGQKFLLMVEEEKETTQTAELGRTLMPLVEVVKRLIDWDQITVNGKENGKMVVD